MAYSADTFVADEQPTTAKWNKLWSNDASFNDGTGIADNAILDRHILTANLIHTKFYNPYKFSAYRAAAHTSTGGGTPAKVPHDTELYDTSSNFDSVTNRRFTAPVAGFYYFTAVAGNTAATSTPMYSYLYKNGSVVKRGDGAESAAAGTSCLVAGVVQLAANDYVEHYFVGGGGSVMTVGAEKCYFDGFLVSAT